RLQGQLVSKSWSSLLASSGARRVPIYTFDGRDVLSDPLWPLRLAWRGSSSGSGRHCHGWRRGGAAQGLAVPLGDGGFLGGTQRRNCSDV
ncbi:COFA1 protein, partial [Crypturellus soui]|nr:COFA1 protein [Crypturellus soui]